MLGVAMAAYVLCAGLRYNDRLSKAEQERKILKVAKLKAELDRCRAQVPPEVARPP